MTPTPERPYTSEDAFDMNTEQGKGTPLQRAIKDLEFMKSKSQDAFSEIVWGMAITICELYIEKENTELEVLNEMYGNLKLEAGEWIPFTEGHDLPGYDEPVLWAFEDGNCIWDSLDKDGNPHLYGGEINGFTYARATHWRKIMTPAECDENFNIK